MQNTNDSTQKPSVLAPAYDVHKTFLLRNAQYSGQLEMPCVRTSDRLPERVIPFSKAVSRGRTDFDAWVVFYEYDRFFERFWYNPKRYLGRLKKFGGVISPDFSLYRGMPLVMQAWNTFRGRALAHWLCENGVEVIPNVRFGDTRTWDFCFDGIEKNRTVAVGTHGCIKKREDKLFLQSDWRRWFDA